MAEPTRMKGIPQAKTDQAIAALVGALGGDGLARLEYPPEPTVNYQIDELAAAKRAARDERQLDPEARRAIQSFGQWRQDVTSRRSQNEARLSTLLWALEHCEVERDSFGAGTIAAYLREEWRVFDPPAANERDEFCRKVCRVECRRGVLGL